MPGVLSNIASWLIHFCLIILKFLHVSVFRIHFLSMDQIINIGQQYCHGGIAFGVSSQSHYMDKGFLTLHVSDLRTILSLLGFLVPWLRWSTFSMYVIFSLQIKLWIINCIHFTLIRSFKMNSIFETCKNGLSTQNWQ